MQIDPPVRARLTSSVLWARYPQSHQCLFSLWLLPHVHDLLLPSSGTNLNAGYERQSRYDSEATCQTRIRVGMDSGGESDDANVDAFILGTLAAATKGPKE